jgi:regulator of protease activity HflC (stomatin/prohibitin superfamily)
MAQLSIPPLPSGASPSRSGLFSVVGPLALLAVLFLLYLASPFFTVGEYERTVGARVGQFSSVAGPGLHFRIPFVKGLETYPIGIQRLQKDHLNTYTVDNQELDALVTLNFRINENDAASIRATATTGPTLVRS